MSNWPLKLSSLVLLICAVSVVYTSFVNRHLAHEWQALGKQHDVLQEEYGRLMLEYSTLAAPSRVESIARKNLEMLFPQKQNTQVIQVSNGL